MLLDAHSGARYLVLILGLAVIAYSGYGLATKRPYDKTMRILASSFTMSLDLTLLFGLGVVFTGTFYPALGGHIMTMVMAVAVAHIVSVVIRKRPLEQRTYAPHLVSAIIVFALLTVGAMAIDKSILR